MREDKIGGFNERLASQAEARRALLEKFNVRFFPTYIFLTAQGDEIERIVGFKEHQEFLKQANKVFEIRTEGMSVLAAKAQKGDTNAKIRLANLALDRQDFQTALAGYLPFEKAWTEAKDPNRVKGQVSLGCYGGWLVMHV